MFSVFVDSLVCVGFAQAVTLGKCGDQQVEVMLELCAHWRMLAAQTYEKIRETYTDNFESRYIFVGFQNVNPEGVDYPVFVFCPPRV